MRIGVLGALEEEVAGIAAMIASPAASRHGGRLFVQGSIRGRQVVIARVRIGKVAAASATVEMIARFGVSSLVVTGVAGGLSRAVAIGDIVVADGLIQHDIDASPLFPPLEVPLTGVTRFTADEGIRDGLRLAAERFVLGGGAAIDRVSSRVARVHRGDIATGDRFIASEASRAEVAARVPSALCVEMEGAAVAQVCHEYGVPFGVVRLISDDAGGSAPAEFLGSLGSLAASYSSGILAGWIASA